MHPTSSTGKSEKLRAPAINIVVAILTMAVASRLHSQSNHGSGVRKRSSAVQQGMAILSILREASFATSSLSRLSARFILLRIVNAARGQKARSCSHFCRSDLSTVGVLILDVIPVWGQDTSVHSNASNTSHSSRILARLLGSC